MLGLLRNPRRLPVPLNHELQPTEDKDSLGMAGDVRQENVGRRLQQKGEPHKGCETGSEGTLKVSGGRERIGKRMT